MYRKVHPSFLRTGLNMADEADMSEAAEQVHKDARIAEVREQAARIPKGEPGDCRWCGEFSQRLVNRSCAPCRDKRGLP